MNTIFWNIKINRSHDHVTHKRVTQLNIKTFIRQHSTIHTWKNPQSLQAKWILSNSEFMQSSTSNLSRSITGTDGSDESWETIKGSSWSSRTYLAGMLMIGSLLSCWTLGTIIDFPRLTSVVYSMDILKQVEVEKKKRKKEKIFVLSFFALGQ